MSSRRNLLKTPHVVHVCVYHVVWATKYRRKVLDLRNTTDGPTVSDRLKQIVEEIAGENQWHVRAIETMPDHVHLFVQADNVTSPRELANAFKGATSRILRNEFPGLRRRLPSLWTRSYFIATAGDVSAAAIQAYVENPRVRPTDPQGEGWA